jgi:3D (Asp-Asp-Asp) domain-containing protein
MITRSVVACMLSGALVGGVVLPDGPLVTVAHARKVAVKRTAKVSQVPQGIHPTVRSTQRGQNSSPPAGSMHPAARVTTQAHPRRSSPPQQRRVKAAAKHIGTFTVRAYTHSHRPGTVPSKTATGTVPRAGHTVAVDPRVIPLGSRIHIEGVGERIAEDTGRKIKGNKLDLFLPSVKDCRQFGVQRQEVHLFTE